MNQYLPVIILQFSLGLILFFIINWIGKHSYSVGYISLGVFVKADEAPAFNLILRILAPVIYILITGAILYSLNLDAFVKDFYLVNLYYIIIRLSANLLTSRAKLINWDRQIIYWLCIMFFSYNAYTKIIMTKKNLLPDYNNLANELWIVIIVYLYNVLNDISLSSGITAIRKENYIKGKIIEFNSLYGKIINTLHNRNLITLAYAILIYEDFNRPQIVRLIERFSMYLTKREHTLGVMQVNSSTPLTDHQSVILGVLKIKRTYANLLDKSQELVTYDDELKKDLDWVDNYYLIDGLIKDYNSGYDYRQGVTELHSIVQDLYKKFPRGHP